MRAKSLPLSFTQLRNGGERRLSILSYGGSDFCISGNRQCEIAKKADVAQHATRKKSCLRLHAAVPSKQSKIST